MRCEYDRDAHALYVRFADCQVVSSASLTPGFVVDLDDQARLVGLEILDLCVLWPLEELAERYGLSLVTFAQLRELAPSTHIVRTASYSAMQPST